MKFSTSVIFGLGIVGTALVPLSLLGIGPFMIGLGFVSLLWDRVTALEDKVNGAGK